MDMEADVFDEDVVSAWLKTIEGPDGRITPDDVVAAARPAKSPGHKYFTWDNTDAANKYRLQQARHLLSVRIRIKTEARYFHAPRYVRDPDAAHQKPQERGYVSIRSAKTEAQLAGQVIAAEIERVKGSLKRAREIAGVLRLEGYVDEALEALFILETHLKKAA